MTDLRVLVLEALIPVYEAADVVTQLFDLTNDPNDRVARGEIGRAVAGATGAVYSTRYQRRVNHALKTLGLTRTTRTNGIPAVIGIRKRNVTCAS